MHIYLVESFVSHIFIQFVIYGIDSSVSIQYALRWRRLKVGPFISWPGARDLVLSKFPDVWYFLP